MGALAAISKLQLAIAAVAGRLCIYAYIWRYVRIESVRTRIGIAENYSQQLYILHDNPHHSCGIIASAQWFPTLRQL